MLNEPVVGLGYQIVEASGIETLQQLVISLLDRGWHPLGGPFVAPGSRQRMCQAMTYGVQSCDC